MIDPMFWNVNRLFVLQFKNGDNDRIRTSFDEYYIPLVEIKDCNALVDNKPFFLSPYKKQTRNQSYIQKQSYACMKNLLKCQETITVQLETN